MIPKSSIVLASLILAPAFFIYGIFYMNEHLQSRDEHVAKYFDTHVNRRLDHRFEEIAIIIKKIDDCDFHARYLQCSASLELAQELCDEQSYLLSGLQRTHERVSEMSASLNAAIASGDLSPLDPRIDRFRNRIEEFETQYSKYHPVQRTRTEMAVCRKCELEVISLSPEEIQARLEVWKRRLDSSPIFARLHIFFYEKI